MTEEKSVVPFGKYKDQPVELLIADNDYRDWLLMQPWFRDRYVNLYQMVINYGAQPSETPEHNEMQVAFLEDDICLRVVRAVEPGLIDDPGCRLSGRRFEFRGWDVAFDYFWTFAIELKPDLGDDFPAVLRQIHSYGGDYKYRRCVIVRRASFEKVTFEQVARIFAASSITLLREQDLL